MNWRAAVFVVVGVCLCSAGAAACSLAVYKPVPVSPNFKVLVLNDEDLAPFTVVLDQVVRDESKNEAVRRTFATVATDDIGVATFEGLPAGDYEVSVERAGIESRRPLKVDPGAKRTKKLLRLEWPVGYWKSLTRVAGSVLAEEADPNARTPVERLTKRVPALKSGLVVTVFSAKDGEQIAEVKTVSDGRFEFPELSPGYYILRISELDVAIHLDPDAEDVSDNFLKLKLESTMCGPYLGVETTEEEAPEKGAPQNETSERLN